MQQTNRNSKLLYYWGGIVLLAVIFLLNWSNYIFDEDDATTIAYHCFGRNAAAEAPYNAYDSMFDHIASFLPPRFDIILHFGVTSTFLSIVLIYVLLAKVASHFLQRKASDLYVYTFAMLLAFPTYIYCSLSIKTSMISFSILLLAHYLLISNMHKANKKLIPILILSSVLCGFGMAIRWNVCIYCLAIFADIAYLQYVKEKWKGMWYPLVWSICTVGFFVLFLFISGYSLKDFFEIMLWGKSFLSTSDFSLASAFAEAAIFFTPISLLAFVTGFIVLMRRYKTNIRVWLFCVCSLLPYFYLDPLYNINIKFLITLFPAIFILFVTGSEYMLQILLKAKWQKAMYWLVLLLPWFVGIQLDNPSTCWGPGFEVNMHSTHDQSNLLHPGKIAKGTTIKVRLADGFAVPTPEGPMPVWGNFYVLFCGKLQDYLHTRDAEAMRVIAIARQQHAHVITTGRTPMFLTGLCKNNYTSKVSEATYGNVIKKQFTNGTDTITMVRVSRHNITNFNAIKQYAGSKQVITFLTYSHLLNQCIEKAPANGVTVIEQMGAFSALYEIQ